MANKNITDLPAGVFAAGHKFEMFNTAANQNQSVTFSIPAAQTVQTQNCVDITLAGNTAGALALISSGTATLAGGNNVTLSQAGNAFTISAANQTVQTQNCVDITLAGNTAGALALISSGTGTLAGGNNVTLSQAGNAVTISAANQTVQTQNCVDVTLAGNTAGALALISSGTATLAGGNNITLSQAGNAITISGPNAGAAAPTVSFFQNAWIMDSVQSNFVAPAINFGIPFVFPLSPDFAVFPGNMTINTLQMVFSQSGSTATMSQSFVSRIDVGLYTNNAGTLSLLNSVSTTWGSNAANVNLSSQYAGLRHVTIHSSLWSAQPVLTQGYYWLGYVINSTNVSAQTALLIVFQMLPSLNNSFFGTVGVSTGASLTNAAWGPFMGSYTSSSASVPVAIPQASILVGASPAGRVPFVILNGMIASY